MDLGLTNHVAFIAGSSRGIGAGIAHGFLREGCRAVITGRDAASLTHTHDAMVQQYGAEQLLAIPADLSQPDAIAAALDQTLTHFGRLDCMVINIGSGRSTPGWDVPESAWQEAFEHNLWSSIRIAQEAMRRMVPAKCGSIVFTASIAALTSTTAPLPYSAAKAALVSYAANLATLAAPHGIRVNCVAPGNILFPGGSWEQKLKEHKDTVDAYLQQHVPQNRFGTPEEIANIAVFLASPRASFVTGACWVADGGQARTW